MRQKNVLKLMLSLSLCVLLMSLFAAQSQAQALKIADVSMTEISNKSQKIKLALEDLRKFQSEPSQKMTALSSEIRQLQENLEKGKANLKEEDKDKIEEQIRAKYQDLQQEQQIFRSKVLEQQKVVNDTMMAQINQAVAKISEEEGLSIVFLKESIIYSKGIPDITNKVITNLDTSVQQPGKK
ncbi:MAG: OmpH family outer membrane protein [Deltaproteobacteria bacterium]|nr:OmpH family outer membrane protein [Deltaproteobacteria bacterium]